MSDKLWKKKEREVGRLFGTRRTPLSGGNSAHTRSDTLHPKLFIEVKTRTVFAAVNYYKQMEEMAVKENKIPLLVLCPYGTSKKYAVMELKKKILQTVLDNLKEDNDESGKSGKTN